MLNRNIGNRVIISPFNQCLFYVLYLFLAQTVLLVLNAAMLAIV